TRAHYRRRYGNDAPEVSMPSRFLEEVPSQLIENLGGRAPVQSSSWSSSGAYGGGSRFGAARGNGQSSDFVDRHYNYEDENQDSPRSPAYSGGTGLKSNPRTASSKPFVASWMTTKAALPSQPSQAKGESTDVSPNSIDNIARFFGGGSGHGRPGSLPRPAMQIATPAGAANLKKGQRVRHAKYGEGTVLLREGDGEDAKLTVLFARHGMKKLMEKFANLQKI
ncbi:MAG: hypothetical protein ABR907_11020, partial [Terracidiphilus sp.]